MDRQDLGKVTLDVPVFGQAEGACGPCSLKAALWYHGHRISAAQIARTAGSIPDGIDHGPLIQLARRFGASVFAKPLGSTEELRWFLERGLPPIIGWWSQDRGDPGFNPAWSLKERREHDCGHYSVVSGIDLNRIQLMDPQWETRGGRLRIVGHRWMPRGHFRTVWYDTDTAAYKRVMRWYMVVHFETEQFAGRMKEGRDYGPLVPAMRSHP